MPSYVAVIISKKKKGERGRKRKVEVFAGCVSEAEEIVLETLKRGERLYDIGGKMSNAMAFERKVNRVQRKDY